MTSKISFFKLARDEWRKLAWMTALFGILFGLLIPFRALMILSLSSRYLDMDDLENLKQFSGEYWRQIGYGHWENTLFILAAGFLCALCVFGYLHSPVKLDFYHSLPLKRRTLFAAKYLGGAFTFILPYAVSQIFALLLGIPWRVACTNGTLEVFAATGQGILYFLVSYTGTILAVMLTGKMLTTVLAVGAFGCYVPMLYLLVELIKEAFLPTYAGEIFGSFGKVMKFSSPWAFCLFQDFSGGVVRREYTTGVWLTKPLLQISHMAGLVLLTAALAALALFLYQKRKTERAGCAIAFRWMEGAIKIALVLPSSLSAGVVGYQVFESVVWGFLFLLLYGFLSSLILEFIYRWDIRQVFANKAHLVFSLAAGCAIFAAFCFDVFGYNAYLPQKEDIAAMAAAVEYSDINNFNAWVEMNVPVADTGDYVETAEFDPLYRIAEDGISRVRKAGDPEPEDETTLRYVSVKYRLKNGKEKYRLYRVSESLFLECMDEVLEQPGYREAFYPILRYDTDRLANAQINLSPENVRSLIEKRDEENLQEDPGQADTDAPSGKSGGQTGEDAEMPVTTEVRIPGAEYDEEYDELTEVNSWISPTIEKGEGLEEFLEAFCSDLLHAPYRDVACPIGSMPGSVSFRIRDEAGVLQFAGSYDLGNLMESFPETAEFLAGYLDRKTLQSFLDASY